MVLLAPKQATFQLERQLLANCQLGGYARLRILSFDRLAEFVLDQLNCTEPRLLAEEGRVMVLRALLNREQERLRLFQGCARLPGFARQLSELLRELQRHQIGPAGLLDLAAHRETPASLAAKLQDTAQLLHGYLAWLQEHQLEDADRLLDVAVEALDAIPGRANEPLIEALWMDGFAEMTPQEMALLTAVTRRSNTATLAFCLDQAPEDPSTWFSAWGMIGDTFRKCHAAVEAIPNATIELTRLERDSTRDRFGSNSVLRHIETHFARPRPAAWGNTIPQSPTTKIHPGWANTEFNFDAPDWRQSISVWQCATLDTEAHAAACEIWRHVRAGGRFREIAVVCRSLELVAPVFRRTFHRYQIPCFIDQRSPVNHHPLAELTRSLLRTLAYGWRAEDWFGVVKSGLVGLEEWESDRLENEALAKGWAMPFWKSGAANCPPETERLRRHLITPVLSFESNIGSSPTGSQLGRAIREFWLKFQVDQTLCHWDRETMVADATAPDAGTLHATIGRQLDGWLSELVRAFPHEHLPLTEWIPILESALAGLTVGRVPPALDQVLIGAMDRSRNPDLRLTILPGWNEGVFPAPAGHAGILSETERMALEQLGAKLGPTPIRRLGHERFYAYIALTRARDRVVITYSDTNHRGDTLQPSPFVSHLQRLFPELRATRFNEAELKPMVPRTKELLPRLEFQSVVIPPPGQEAIDPALARLFYGDVLRSSVSRLEQFASCPFLYAVQSGLRLGERKRFEMDARERGSFQHEILARFHESIARRQQRWRDVSIPEARALVRELSETVAADFRHGLACHNGAAIFSARHLAWQLEELISETLAWMPGYSFDPKWSELEFGSSRSTIPALELDLGEGLKLQLEGKVDRIDVDEQDPENIRAVVMDYKSSLQSYHPVLATHGIQMQLPVYLAALSVLTIPGVGMLNPSGMGYISLKPTTQRSADRHSTTGGSNEPRFAIRGRFSLSILTGLQRSTAETTKPPFRVDLKRDGTPKKHSDILLAADFDVLIAQVFPLLARLGKRILNGETAVSPYRNGAETACDFCDFKGVCRIRPETFHFRSLKTTG